MPSSQADPFQRGLFFESVAPLYDRARPDYPDALFDDLIGYAGDPPVARALEIGCATGQATIPLARRGIALTCLEPGAQLAALAQKNLAPFPNVEVTCRRFEDWRPPKTPFDLVLSANAIHWVKRRSRVRKPAQVLRPNGVLALFRSRPVDCESRLVPALERVLEQPLLGQASPRAVPREEDFRNSKFFGDFEIRHYEFERHYDAQGFVALLATLNRLKTIPELDRNQRFRAVYDLLSKERETVGLKFQTRLLLARRRSPRSWLSALRSGFLRR